MSWDKEDLHTAWMVYSDLKDHANPEVERPPFVERYLAILGDDERRELMDCLALGHEGRMSFDDAILLCGKIGKQESEELERLIAAAKGLPTAKTELEP